jgi:hypothetical protein
MSLVATIATYCRPFTQAAMEGYEVNMLELNANTGK